MSGPEQVLVVRRRARAAYELGMLRVGLLRAALVTGLVGGLGALGVSQPVPAALLLAIFMAWWGIAWRGALWWRGALGGLGVGLVGMALPASLLWSCCRPGAMGGATCSMAQACLAFGAVLGAGVAATLPPTRSPADAARASLGALLGAASLLACRCESMLLGESAGLLGGLLASAAGLVALRAWWQGRPLHRA